MIFIRVLVALFLALPLALPAAFLKVEMVGSPIVIMFTNIFIPGMIGCGLAVLGPYDFLVHYFYSKFLWYGDSCSNIIFGL